MDYESKKVFLVNAAFIAVWIALYYFLGKFLFAFLLPFIIAVILSFFTHKAEAFLKNKIPLKESRLRCVILGAFYFVLVMLVVLLIWVVFKYSDGVFERLKLYLESPDNIFYKFKDALLQIADRLPADLNGAFNSLFDNFSQKIMSSAASFVSSLAMSFASFLPKLLISTAVTVVASFYIAKDYKQLLKFLKNMLGSKRFLVLGEIKDILTGSVLKLAGGYLILSFICFLELWIGFSLLSVKYAMPLALLVAVIDLLPILGSGTVLVPFSIISFINRNTALGIGLMVLYIIVSVARNFLEPKIISRKLNINPLLMLITLFVGLRVGGLGGMLLLPITVVTVITYYKRQMDDVSE